jgi:hypothetical protein
MNPFDPTPEACRYAALFSAYGVRFGVLTDTVAVLDGLAERVPAGSLQSMPASALRSDGVHRLFSVIGGDEVRIFDKNGEVGRPSSLADAIDALRTEIQMDFAEMAPAHVVVHAGVVGWNGRAVMFPGHSYAGKSTLVAALVHAGATYYSDEFAVLDHDGRVHPYARPLGMRANGGRVWLQTAEQLGGRAGNDPLPLGMVVLTRYVREATWSPRIAPPGYAATRLMRQSLLMRRDPERAISILAAACSRVRCVRSERGEPDAVISWMRAGCPVNEHVH